MKRGAQQYIYYHAAETMLLTSIPPTQTSKSSTHRTLRWGATHTSASAAGTPSHCRVSRAEGSPRSHPNGTLSSPQQWPNGVSAHKQKQTTPLKNNAEVQAKKRKLSTHVDFQLAVETIRQQQVMGKFQTMGFHWMPRTIVVVAHISCSMGGRESQEPDSSNNKHRPSSSQLSTSPPRTLIKIGHTLLGTSRHVSAGQRSTHQEVTCGCWLPLHCRVCRHPPIFDFGKSRNKQPCFSIGLKHSSTNART
jgi:hypothetical protein